jgi:hypothetical protein
MNQISSNADGESGRGSTGDDSGLLDRRAYLRLTGATVAGVAATSAGSGAVSAASVETIEVSSGEEERIELDGGDTLENTIIDVSARGASVAIRARTRGGDIAIRNVAIEGVDTQADDTINVAAYDEDATVTIENCYFGDGGEDDAGDGAGEGEGCIFVNASHAGDLLIRNVHVANFETGIYASAPGNPPVESKPDKQVGEGGTVRIEDTYLANVEKSGYKLGSTGSYVENSIAKDAGNPVFVVWNEIDARDVDIRNRGEEAFNVGYKFDPAGEEAVAVIEDCRAEAERYVVGPGSARGEVDPNPDLSPPDGVPMSPEEAASGEDGSDGGGGDGGSGDDGGSDGGDDGSGDDGGDGGSDLPNRLRVQATGDLTTYEFTVSGALEAGPDFDTDGTDGIDGSSAQGQVNTTGSDDYYFGGEVTRFERDGDLEVYVNGEEVDPDGFGSDEPARSLSVVGTGPRVEYELSVSGELEKSTARDGSINSSDEIDGSTATGYVLGGTDSYRFAGEITDLTVDDPDAVSIYLDGEEVDPARFGGSDSFELTISNRGYDEPATYEFTVTGAIEATSSVNPTDEIDGATATGQVNGGADTYRYTGAITAFDSDGPLDVAIDGNTVYSSG